ncbi:hypothetical protein GCM10010277_85260 [Streptomyces longisporoflavus]|uniref:hypothetical protein n=1 Tax=Streptomyces longisporoflavus TaxID=28044 RepID=UPI0019B82174|nr:hypothetical protein [Streptomyces longisporoflavus]GGV72398.1 hypothetical protein GCM10010277_85260 [Streptomyces longisporoflavus]
MDRVGLAAALFDEGEAERGSAAAQQALDDAARVDSTLVVFRHNTLLDAACPYETAAVDEMRTRVKDLAAARPLVAATAWAHGLLPRIDRSGVEPR